MGLAADGNSSVLKCHLALAESGLTEIFCMLASYTVLAFGLMKTYRSREKENDRVFRSFKEIKDADVLEMLLLQSE